MTTRPRRRREVAMPQLDPLRVQPIAVVATVGGVVLAVATRLRGPGAVAALVLFALGLALIDGIGRQRFSLRQGVVFLMTIAVGLGAWAAVVVFLLGVVELPVATGVQAVVITAAACALGAVVLGVAKRVVANRTVQPLSARRAAKGPQTTGFERDGSTRQRTQAKRAATGSKGAATKPGAPAKRPSR